MDEESNHDYFRRVFAESDRKRHNIINQVRAAAGPGDDLEWITARELHRAGLISVSELHATGSSELLPRGWYQHYVEAIDEYCPTRVWGVDEPSTSPDPEHVSLYERGFRWMTVFSQFTGVTGDSTFIHIRDFAAECMTENPLEENSALEQLEHMGYRLAELPSGIALTRNTAASQAPLAPKGWYHDPSGRFQSRWWDGRIWTGMVFNAGATFQDLPL